MLSFANAFCSRPPSRMRISSCVPRNLNEVVQLGARSIDAACASNVRRMQLGALVPGLNPGLEDSFPYNEQLLLMLVRALVLEAETLRDASRVALLFKSEGTAASAKAVYKREADLPEHVTIASYYSRDRGAKGVSRLADSDGCNIVVNPVNARGNPVINDIMELVNEEPDATWILLNPDFSADRSALGMREVNRREEFLKDFKHVLYFRNLFVIKRPKLIPVEKGALLFSFGHPWTVFSLRNGDYLNVAQFESQPDRSAITAAIENAPIIIPSTAKTTDDSGGIQDEQYLTTVGILAVAVSGIFWFFKSYPNL